MYEHVKERLVSYDKCKTCLYLVFISQFAYGCFTVTQSDLTHAYNHIMLYLKAK